MIEHCKGSHPDFKFEIYDSIKIPVKLIGSGREKDYLHESF